MTGEVKRVEGWFIESQGLCPETVREGGVERAHADFHPGDTRGAVGEAQSVEQGGLGFADDPAAQSVQRLRPGTDEAYHPLGSGEACGNEE